jgi:hypothetical protein
MKRLFDFDRVRRVQPTCLLSARHRVTGEWRTVCGQASVVPMGRHTPYGSMLGAIANAVFNLEREPGPWEVMSISTPDRILRDLRQDRDGGTAARPYEAGMLGRIGRPDLIADVGQRR